MARVELSALVNNISGKLNGSVFQRTQGGLSIRSQAGKINSNTARSNSHKVGTAAIQTDWQNLSVNDRALWDTYAIYLNKKQKKNPTLSVSGHQLFLSINSIRFDLSGVNALFQPYLLSAPILNPIPAPIQVESVFSDGMANIVNFDRVIDDTTEVVILFLSCPLRATQMSGHIKTVLIKAATIAGAYLNTSDYYTEVFGRVLQPYEYVQTKVAVYSTVSQNFSSYSIKRFNVA